MLLLMLLMLLLERVGEEGDEWKDKVKKKITVIERMKKSQEMSWPLQAPSILQTLKA